MKTNQSIKITIVILVACMALGFYAPCEDAESSEISKPVKLSMVSAFFVTGPYAREKNIVGYLLMEKFNARAKGKYEINIAGGPEVVSASDHLKVLRSGQFDLAITTASFYPELRDVAVRNYITYEKQVELGLNQFKLMQKVTQDQGIVWLSSMSMGVQGFIWTTKKKVTSVVDFKGLKIRVPGEAGIALKNLLGVTLVNISPQELYGALQTGLVDGTLRGLPSIYYENEGEVLKFGVPVRGMSFGGDIFISGRTWDKLPEDITQLLYACAREAERESLEASYNKMKELRTNVEKKFGVTISEPDPELNHILSELIARESAKLLLEKSKYRNEIIEGLKLGKIF